MDQVNRSGEDAENRVGDFNSLSARAIAAIQSVAGASVPIAFTQNPPFNKLSQYMSPPKNIVSDIVFLPDETNAIAGAVTVAEIIGDGVHNVSFSGISVSSGSSGFVADNGVTNYLVFICIRPGVYFVNIFQAKSGDVTAPSLVTATVEDANKNKIVMTYSETLNGAIIPATTDFAVSGGKTVSNVAIAGAVVTLTVNSNYAFGDTITVSYTRGVNKIQDLVGNFAASLVTQAVTNNVAQTAIAITPTNFINAAWDGTTCTVVTNLGSQAASARFNKKLPNNVNGYFEILPDATGGLLFGVMAADTPGNAYATIACGMYVYSGNYVSLPDNTVTAIAFIAGDKWRVRRAGGFFNTYLVRGGVETLISTAPVNLTIDSYAKAIFQAVSDTFTLPVGLAVV